MPPKPITIFNLHSVNLRLKYWFSGLTDINGGVAQMVERSLSMREVPGSIPGASKIFFHSLKKVISYITKHDFMISV